MSGGTLEIDSPPPYSPVVAGLLKTLGINVVALAKRIEHRCFYAHLGPVPPFLFALRARVAEWSGIDASQFSNALIAVYRMGTRVGWHSDVPNFESVVGILLTEAARPRFRPFMRTLPHGNTRRSR